MDILSDILGLLKLKSTLYFRTALHAPWGIRVPDFENVARFHFVHRGRCWISVGESGEKTELNQGDLVIVPHGMEHSIYDPIDAKIETLEHATSDYIGEGVFTYGTRGTQNDTQLVCGHWSFDPYVSHPLIEMLPGCLHVPRSNALGSWLEHTLSMIGYETETNHPGNQQIVLKLSETILIQAIRNHLSFGQSDMPFYRALKDQKILGVLNALHRSPSTPWNLASMSEIANMSRTSFVNRFTQLVGMTPIQYLIYWRMQISVGLLFELDRPIIDIAERVGYQSEAAFGRVFKKHFSMGPASYRKTMKQ